MASTGDIASSFIEGAPPGELSNVVDDLKNLTPDDPSLIQKLGPAFRKYNEDQLTTTKLPGSSQPVIISKYNLLPDGRYYDTESSKSFEFDHITQKASSPQSYTPTDSSSTLNLANSLLKSLSTYYSEHFPSSQNSAYTVCPSADSLTILLVSNKYSPTNFYSGRWRSTYHFSPSSSALTGTIQVHVHYYEDGNVALTTSKPVSLSLSSTSSNADEIVKAIAKAERGYQEDLNRAFVNMNEGAFKGLRRQLPITRQKMEWEKVSGYKLGSDLRGGR